MMSCCNKFLLLSLTFTFLLTGCNCGSFCGVMESNETRVIYRAATDPNPKYFGELHVPVALFYDKALLKKAGNNGKQLKKLVVTLMKTAQTVFDSPLIRKFANITFYVVKLEQAVDLEGKKKWINGTDGNADHLLRDLSEYQHLHKDSDTWQIAMLLTGVNIFAFSAGNKNPRAALGTTGYANVRVICEHNGRNAVGLVEVRNFNSAYVLAHEIAHVFGVDHDGGLTNRLCDIHKYVMSPSTGDGKTAFSSCSADNIYTHLVDIQQQKRINACLKQGDTTFKVVKGFEDLRSEPYAGQIYDADSQCQYSHGSDYKADFTTQTTICPMMYCIHNLWKVKSHPALPGTLCSPGKMCDPSASCV